jgi:hypothetical protein
MSKQLKDRHFDKELRLKLNDLNNKENFITYIVYILTNFLPEDINKIEEFRLSFEDILCDFYIYYKGLETDSEYKERLAKEQAVKDKKLIKLHKLAAELDYKLEKVNE